MVCAQELFAEESLRLRILPTLVTLIAFSRIVACVSSGSGARPATSDRIARAEIASASATNAYELISRLRPNWLRPSGTGSIGGGVRNQLILVYIDQQRAEDLNALKTVSTSMITSVQWIDASRVATVVPNVPPGSYAGAILIKTH
jgi:hypothetical protein